MFKRLTIISKMNKSTVIKFTIGVTLLEVVWVLYKKYNLSLYNNSLWQFIKNCVHQTREANFTEVMFFSDDSAMCRMHINKKISLSTCKKPQCAVAQFRKLIDYLSTANNTLDICIYFLTSREIGNVVVEAHKRGVVVRVIIDATMGENIACPINVFRLAGIKVRSKRFKGDTLMHHKFAIIDGKMLITGSTNWTMNAFFGNFDNILITNAISTVERFSEEFERLWTSFNNKQSNGFNEST